VLDQTTLNAGVAEPKKHGMLTVAHARTVDATRIAVGRASGPGHHRPVKAITRP